MVPCVKFIISNGTHFKEIVLTKEELIKAKPNGTAYIFKQNRYKQDGSFGLRLTHYDICFYSKDCLLKIISISFQNTEIKESIGDMLLWTYDEKDKPIGIITDKKTNEICRVY